MQVVFFCEGFEKATMCISLLRYVLQSAWNACALVTPSVGVLTPQTPKPSTRKYQFCQNCNMLEVFNTRGWKI